MRPDETISNTAQTRFTSIDGSPGTISPYNANSTERTGANGPGAGLNNYATNGCAQLDIYDPTPTKSLPTSSESSTSGNAVAIGEIARYRVTSRLAEGTAPAFQLVDQLPAGLLMLNDGTARVAFVSNGGGITSSTLSGAGLAVTGNESTLGSDHTHFRPPGRGHHRRTVCQRDRPDIQPGHAHQLGQRRRPGVRRPGVQRAGREHLDEPKPA